MFEPQRALLTKSAMKGLVAVVIALGLLLATETAQAQTPPASANPLQEPMTFERVQSDDPACRPNCPEWIAAQGKIEIGTAQAFDRVVADLRGRRLPVLINSGGGSVNDAIAMGRLIRKKQLAVAVARTVLSPCAPPVNICDEKLAKAIAYGAGCASACPLILAAGVERYASPLSYIAVHQVAVTLTQQFVVRHFQVQYRVVDGRKEEVSRSLLGESFGRKTAGSGSPDQIDHDVGAYLKEMGVGSPVMDEILATPNTEIHRLTWQDLSNSNLVTMWIDQMSAMIGGVGVNGLAGKPATPTSGRTALFVAKGAWPFALPVNEKTVALQVEFDYRRGGGVVEAAFSTHDPVSGAGAGVRGVGFTMKLGDSEYRLANSGGDDPSRQAIPLNQFCKLSSQAKISIGPFDGPTTGAVDSAAAANPHEPPVAVDVTAIEGGNGLFAEACSPLAIVAAKDTKELKESPKEISTHEKPRRDLIITY
jgi:hypothetical protein